MLINPLSSTIFCPSSLNMNSINFVPSSDILSSLLTNKKGLAIAVITNKNNEVKDLTLEQVKDIYTGFFALLIVTALFGTFNILFQVYYLKLRKQKLN